MRRVGRVRVRRRVGKSIFWFFFGGGGRERVEGEVLGKVVGEVGSGSVFFFFWEEKISICAEFGRGGRTRYINPKNRPAPFLKRKHGRIKPTWTLPRNR